MLNQQLIFLPLLAQVLLTALVWIWMYKTRIAEMQKKKIKPQALTSTLEAAPLLKSVAGPSDNFSNLFEVPVLFYVAVITLYVTQMTDSLFLSLATLFVILRYLHSFIHCSYNNVMQRFIVYIASTVTLWVMWGVIGFKIVSAV